MLSVIIMCGHLLFSNMFHKFLYFSPHESCQQCVICKWSVTISHCKYWLQCKTVDNSRSFYR